MLQVILSNYAFAQECIQATRENWYRKCTSEPVGTDNSFHFCEARN